MDRIPLRYSDIGGADKQIQEMVEAIVLPMTHKERFAAIGIRPPKGARGGRDGHRKDRRISGQHTATNCWGLAAMSTSHFREVYPLLTRLACPMVGTSCAWPQQQT